MIKIFRQSRVWCGECTCRSTFSLSRTCNTCTTFTNKSEPSTCQCGHGLHIQILRELKEVQRHTEEVVFGCLHETVFNNRGLDKTILGPQADIKRWFHIASAATYTIIVSRDYAFIIGWVHFQTRKLSCHRPCRSLFLLSLSRLQLKDCITAHHTDRWMVVAGAGAIDQSELVGL